MEDFLEERARNALHNARRAEGPHSFGTPISEAVRSFADYTALLSVHRYAPEVQPQPVWTRDSEGAPAAAPLSDRQAVAVGRWAHALADKIAELERLEQG